MECELNGRKFRWTKLDARAQLKVMIKLTPILSPVVLAAVASGRKDVSAELLITALGPTMSALAGLPDVDVDLILDTCLAVVSIEMPGAVGWAPIMAAGGGLMFVDTITTAAMLTLCYRVLEGPMRDFFDEMSLSFAKPKDAVPA